MVRFEMDTTAAVLRIETVRTVVPPSIIVLGAAAPINFRLMLMVMFSEYVAAAILMESPAEAREIACPIVKQGVSVDKQLLLSLPLFPSTYHVVLAIAAGIR